MLASGAFLVPGARMGTDMQKGVDAVASTPFCETSQAASVPRVPR